MQLTEFGMVEEKDSDGEENITYTETEQDSDEGFTETVTITKL